MEGTAKKISPRHRLLKCHEIGRALGFSLDDNRDVGKSKLHGIGTELLRNRGHVLKKQDQIVSGAKRTSAFTLRDVWHVIVGYASAIPAFSSAPSYSYSDAMAGNLALKPIEQEIIVLRAVWDMVDGMVNYENLEKGHGTVETQVMFKTAAHQRLFNILLVDFLSKPPKGTFDLPEAYGPTSTDHTYLFFLRRICDEPKLNQDSDNLRAPVEAFVDWLEDECFVEMVALTSIDVEADIRVKRITFLKICGDIAKHNFARLNWTVQRVTKVLAKNGVEVDEGQGFLALPEFYEWFHDKIFNYHGSTIAELLNNIRWGIFEYLTPEFDRSYEKVDPKPRGYRFNFPAGCDDPLAKAMYWDLMNKVRTKPWFPIFTTTPALKERY